MGTLGVGQVGQHQERPRALVFHRVELNPQLFDLLGPYPVGILHRRGVLSHTAGACDLVSRRILLPFQPLELGDDAPARRLERGDLLEGFVRIRVRGHEARYGPPRYCRGYRSDQACAPGSGLPRPRLNRIVPVAVEAMALQADGRQLRIGDGDAARVRAAVQFRPDAQS